MGGLLGYSQPWKPLVCSCDANCLQPDTFLDLAARVEASIKHVEAPRFPHVHIPDAHLELPHPHAPGVHLGLPHLRVPDVHLGLPDLRTLEVHLGLPHLHTPNMGI